jgi:upstream activation factor subunit UAF30
MAPKKSTQATTPVQVEEPVTTVVPPAVEETVQPAVDVAVPDRFVQVLDKLQSFVNDVKELMVVVKGLQKEHVKLQKQSVKKVKKPASATADGAKRSPSGFAKPTKLSDELCDFLGVPKGSAMARTIVTKHINEYIKKNNLQDSSDKRHILPDARLKSILSIKEEDKLTYFNLQTFIKQHFKKE